MAIHFRSLVPLALPGMLALIGWWWFHSRKKEHVSSHSKQAEASAVGLRTDPATAAPLPVEDACPGAGPTTPTVMQPPEKEPPTMRKPCTEPPDLLWAHPAPRRSESSGSLPGTMDTRFRPGTRKDDGAKLEIALTCDEAKSIPLECPLPSPKGVPFPHEAVEACKRESVYSRMPGRGQPALSAAPTEKRGPGEKAWETGGTEGTGDAVLGENVLEEGVMSQHGSGLENSKVPSLAPLRGGEENGKTSLAQVVGTVQKEECIVRKSLSSFIESAHTERDEDDEKSGLQVRGGTHQDRDLVEEQCKDEILVGNEKIEQVAIQIISKVILEATEEVLAITADKIAGQKHQTSTSQLQGQKEESCAPDSQTAVPQQDATEPTPATAVAATDVLSAAPPSSDPPAEDLSPPKTHVSCLNSPLSSPTEDSTPKNSVHPVSLAACPPLLAPLGESLDEAGTLVEDAGGLPCMSDSSQGVPSVVSSGPCSDSASTSGLDDSCTETNSSPRDKASTLPLPKSTLPFSNGVLSDLGAEDGWTMDAEADHSGGSDRNSMDSVDSCCGPRKPEGFQSVQAGSDPKKVDLIIWEIEVPKHLVGRLIGKQGRYVSFLKQTSGAKIYISTLPYTQNIQICHIEGSQHHVDKALNLIGKKFKELNLTNIYAPPLPSLALPSLPMTSWLMLPSGITVEVIVVNQVNAGHLFVQQHTHPTFHALRSLDQQMYLCYSQPGIPTLPTPVEIAVICAAPGADGAWWRAQVVASYEETNEVEIRYVDYGGYKRVKVDTLRQIRSDFVTLPFQGAEVLLDSVMPLSDDDHFSPEADAAMSEMTENAALLAQVTSYSPIGLPLIQLWSVVGNEVVLINRSLVERGLAQWIDSYYTSL
ncbi:A-kinase anchor protein 1, mitochondrial [Choloepus didactylus]|uniref:A-kinase anchor protein 1, mitochondrial n=1 Tax=Choloepus didactylus TaxID=27675 RepID=UPI00189E9DC5|nr:A-kinase anchor protein 1, mitochondrial [Choloepus didactylus]XP_037666320.1 A-kinase anchor protein 1, mitochondrial [Choloepus didactylus]